MAGLRELVPWRRVATVLLALLATAVIAAPVAAEQAVERAHFADRLGALPVEASLCHNGYSSLDTGILGTLYWKQTGMFGFGACVRVTEPPVAGGTLSSYVDEKFIRTTTQLVGDPEAIATAYGREFVSEFWRRFLRIELLLTGLGLLFFLAASPRGRLAERTPWWGGRLARRLAPHPRVRAIVFPVLLVLVGLTASTAYAGHAFEQWSQEADIGTTYPLADVPGLSFSSPQAREIAAQVRPFIEKNTQRLEERSTAYQGTAIASFEQALAARSAGLVPREGEKIVLGEADPQGSQVATALRRKLYPLLLGALGEDAVVLRTISGDVTSNGTVAEDGFVEDEARSAGDLPVVAAGGDHDSTTTVKQMKKYGIVVPDLETVTISGMRVSAANDREFKTLFGGMITNPTGVSEEELGEKLRAEVDPDEAGIVLVHQPDAAAAYLGIDGLGGLDVTLGHETEPFDDGIADVPPGTLNVGHLHRPIGPWVIWNDDTDEVTWTVVDQLGTSGGVEGSPTFNRFSTPFSVPLKPVNIRLQYVDTESGLQTGYATITIDLDGNAEVTGRTEVGIRFDR